MALGRLVLRNRRIVFAQHAGRYQRSAEQGCISKRLKRLRLLADERRLQASTLSGTARTPARRSACFTADGARRTPRRRPRREVQEPQTGPESVVAEGQDRVLTLPRILNAFAPSPRKINGRPYYDGGLKPYLTEIGRDRLRGTANFLKHADRDPDARLSPPSPGDIDWRIGLPAHPALSRSDRRVHTDNDDLNSVREQQFARGPVSQEWLEQPLQCAMRPALAFRPGCGDRRW